jgi:hypothetical protein
MSSVMPATTRQKITINILRGVALLGGLVGIALIVVGVLFIIKALNEKDYFALASLPFFTGMGIILILIAFQMFFRFSQAAIKNLTVILAFVVFALLSRLIMPLVGKIWEQGSQWFRITILFVPMLVAFIFYQLLKRLLIYLTLK